MDIVTREYSFPSVTGLSEYLCEELGSLGGEGGNRCDSDFARHGGTYRTI